MPLYQCVSASYSLTDYENIEKEIIKYNGNETKCHDNDHERTERNYVLSKGKIRRMIIYIIIIGPIMSSYLHNNN